MHEGRAYCSIGPHDRTRRYFCTPRACGLRLSLFIHRVHRGTIDWPRIGGVDAIVISGGKASLAVSASFGDLKSVKDNDVLLKQVAKQAGGFHTKVLFANGCG